MDPNQQHESQEYGYVEFFRDLDGLQLEACPHNELKVDAEELRRLAELYWTMALFKRREVNIRFAVFRSLTTNNPYTVASLVYAAQLDILRKKRVLNQVFKHIVGSADHELYFARLRALGSVLTKKVDDSCAVCIETCPLGTVLWVLPCQHSFHDNCIIPWVKTSNECPLCRGEIHSN